VGWWPVERMVFGGGPGWSVTLDDPGTLGAASGSLLPEGRRAVWEARLGAGWEHLARFHGGEAASVRAAVRTLNPLPTPVSGHVSGTHRHASGCLSISLPTDARSTAATLVHELSALMDLFELVDMSSPARGYAPWRDDPRPPAALLHGAYAHLSVAAFWREESRRPHSPGPGNAPEPVTSSAHKPGTSSAHKPGARNARNAAAGNAHSAGLSDGRGRRTGGEHEFETMVEYVRWRDATADVCAGLLADAPLTPVGRAFVSAMTSRLATWSHDTVPPSVLAEAARRNAAHRQAAPPA
jgi:hypothetical protein